jgi:redox-sensing transcriptional repressor
MAFSAEVAMNAGNAGTDKTPSLAAIRRMPMYLRVLKGLDAAFETVSATKVAEALGLEAIVVRKDLELAGIVGRPGVGYPVKELIGGIENLLGWNNLSDAVLVGAGSLGTAILGYQGFGAYGMNVICAFDTDPDKVGKSIYGKKVLPLNKLVGLVGRMHVQIGIITVPKEYAQGIADTMVQVGIRAIWNFAPVKLKVPAQVDVQNEDLAEGLAALSVKLTNQHRR